MIKKRKELKLLSKAAQISSKSFIELLNHIKIGTREIDLAFLLEQLIKENGASGIGFDTLLTSGKRGHLVHGKPSAKAIGRGEFVLVDFGALYKGYRSDETCTVVL